MIISNTIEKFGDIWRLVTYDTDDAGKCTPRYRASEFQDEIETFYEQQAERLKILQEKLLEGTINPIGFFMEHCRMDAKDLAARLQVRTGTVKKHLSPNGFGSLKVETLAKYAEIFNISVSDFFQFTFVPDTVSIELKHFRGRLLQHVTISENK